MNLVKSTKWMKHFHAGETISLHFSKNQAIISIAYESVRSYNRISTENQRFLYKVTLIKFHFFNLAAFLKSFDFSRVFKLSVSLEL